MVETKSSRDHRWRTFWIVWGVILIGFNLVVGIPLSRTSPFTKSYTLGADEVTEEHHFSFLAWPRYEVEVVFDGAGWDTLGTPHTSVRDAIGGDLELELTSDRGETVIPRSLALADKELGRAGSRANRVLDERWYSLRVFEPRTNDHWTLEVKAVKTSPSGTPRRVELRIRGWESGQSMYLLILVDWILVPILLLVSAMILMVIPRKSSAPFVGPSTGPAGA